MDNAAEAAKEQTMAIKLDDAMLDKVNHALEISLELTF